MDLGKNIAKARKNANLTQEQLAEKLQVARQTVSKWEAGTTMPTVPGLVKLAKALETDCNSLLEKEEKQPEIKQTETGYVMMGSFSISVSMRLPSRRAFAAAIITYLPRCPLHLHASYFQPLH